MQTPDGGRAQQENGGGITAPLLRRSRLYQLDLIERLDATPEQRELLVAPTGSGKTVIAAEIIRRAIARGERVLFLAHRRLIAQAHAKLYVLGIDAGIIQAGFEPRPEQTVQVASIQTLWARAYRGSPDGATARQLGGGR